MSSSLAMDRPANIVPPDTYNATTRRTVEEQCRVPFSLVEDILPCTPLQETMWAATMKDTTATMKDTTKFVQKRSFQLNQEVDLQRLQAAWKTLVSRTPILRARMASLDGGAFSLVIIKEEMDLPVFESLSDYHQAAESSQHQIRLGARMTWAALVKSPEDGGSYDLLWTIHHCLYDAWSFELMLGHWEHLYHPTSKTYQAPVPFTDLVRHAIQCGSERSLQFWRTQFQEAAETCQHFPHVPMSYDPTPDTVETHRLDGVKWDQLPWSKDIIIRAALTLLLAQRTSQDNVVFGVVSAGRKAPVQGVERMAFPALATMPLLNRVDRRATLNTFLQQLRDQRRSMYAHEHTGLQRLRRLGGNAAAHACSFQTLLVVQSGQESRTGNSIMIPTDGPDRRAERLLNFATSALTLECEPDITGLVIHASCDAAVLAPSSAVRLCHQLGHVVQTLCELGGRAGEVLLGEIPMLSPQDSKDIWRWNPAPPALQDKYLDELVLEAAAKTPHAQAVQAWDGELEYHELDALSTRLAERLHEAGLGRGSLVAICSQKSKWIPVAILGVLRSGAAFVTFDPSAPSRRVASMLRKTRATFLLTASPDSLLELPDGINCFDLRTLPSLQPHIPAVVFPRGSTADVAYICFTSGSTGQPKGIIVSHAAAATNLLANAATYNLCTTTRTLCYSSLAFDGFLFEMICTLICSGCLCIPSQEQAMIDTLPGFLRAHDVNTAFLTPAVLRQFRPSELPTIKTLLCGGEAVGEDLAKLWAGKVKLFCVYGPTETVVMSLAHRVGVQDKGPPPIGKGLSVRTWVVHKGALQIIGAVGELHVEGEALAQGYLDDAERTAAVFSQDPPWLLKGDAEGEGGRTGRVYKTGDLVRYRDDGSLEFCGRADTQIKIRGQRTELAEIEVHARRSIPAELATTVVIEYTPPQDGTNNILLAFVVLADNHSSAEHAVQEIVAHTHRELAQRLPSYMIPTHLLILDRMPTTVSGKVDRKKLQAWAKSTALANMYALSPDKVSATSRSTQAPMSQMEKTMQELWASIVERDRNTITADDTFFDVGGDSILAMRLVGLARQRGIELRTSDILQQQTLADTARAAIWIDPKSSGDIAPFSILTSLSTEHADLKEELADLCFVNPSQILDAYPCSPFQERVMTVDPGIRDSLIAHFIHRLDSGVDLAALRRAVDAEQKSNPILRTRIVQSASMGTIQVVIDSFTPCQLFPTPAAFAEHHSLRTVQFGTPLSTFSIISSGDPGTAYLAIIAHHAIFDGWSISLLLRRLCTAYTLDLDEEARLSPPTPYQTYIHHLSTLDKNADKLFWQTHLKGCTGHCFPSVPADVNLTRLNVTCTTTHEIQNIIWPHHTNTPAAYVRAALAILYAQYSDDESANESLFCEAFTGRATPIPGIEAMTGPTLGTVPMRIILSPDETVRDLVDRVARQAMETERHAHCSRAQIRTFNEDTDRGCEFTSFVIIQPVHKRSTDEADGGGGGVIKERVVLQGLGERQPLHLNPLLVEIELRPQGLKIVLRSDERVLDGRRCRRFVREFEKVLRMLVESGERLVGDVSRSVDLLDDGQ